MKRARIKAMVSVPPRRKVTQDTSVTETVNVIECDEKNKSKSDDTCLVLQETPENDSQEKQVEENLAIIEQTQSEQLRHNKQDTQCEDESKQNSDESRKETTQSSENLNTTQIVTPIKSAQCRVGYIRPTPKLDSGGRVRRNSIQGSGASASESEDDSRRVNCATINHTRNDLIHSAESVKDTIANNTKNLQKSKIGQKRRILVSESARKLAEARREFHIKHENKTPDRTKLTMYDLIYYNPITNPMKRSKESGMVARKISECQSEEIQEEEEENVDDPSSAMPVPQVKVGPDGQLIIDEQSLVIEQTNAKKALNTVGTDFLLMQSLFPNRTRQEIKLKFKKEEKVNRNLVEKALAYHQEFDTDMLEKSLATFESSEKEHSDTLEKRKLQRPAEKKKFKISKKRKCRIVATSIAEMDASDEEENCLEFMVQNENLEKEQCEEVFNKTNKRSHKGSREEVKILEKSSIEIDDVQSLSVYNGFDSDSEVYHVRPTRSGRLPKVKKLQGPDINTLDNEILNYGSIDHETITSPKDDLKIANNLIIDNINTNQETQCTSSVKTVIPNIDNVEPGSLVILSKESPEEPGKSVLQVYMVSSNINSSQTLKESNITSVNLPPELLATVSTKLSDAESITVKQEYE
ncbi:titin homolog isoform X2 [Colletes gigas]|uniref:titin homolog isoform X2 n=1 Tax=Colletes gigas TaxID=935657 RepID=UPI001C9AC6B8|nr:titin homolog isoform X2 [Colletes gigas]